MAGEQIMIRSARPDDAPAWLRLRNALWPNSFVNHKNEIAAYFEGKQSMPTQVLIAFAPKDEAIGFVELAIRPHAEGCVTGRVLILEGWYVEPAWRKHGAGAKLIQAAEAWGREQGCMEFASASPNDNLASHKAHRALGFTEVERIVNFRKAL